MEDSKFIVQVPSILEFIKNLPISEGPKPFENILITGAKGPGCSALAQVVLKKLTCRYRAFVTVI